MVRMGAEAVTQLLLARGGDLPIGVECTPLGYALLFGGSAKTAALLRASGG